MKKLFTILTSLLCCTWSMAQSLTFTCDGKAIENGSTFTSDKASTVEIPGLGAQVTFSPEICIKSDKEANVVITLTAGNEKIQFCAIDGSCITAQPNQTVTKTGLLKANIDSDLMIEYISEFLPDANNITVNATIEAWYEGDESNKISVKLIMSNDPAVTPVENVNADKNNVSYDGETLYYAFDNNAAHTLNVYTTDGKLAMQTALYNQNGNISLNTLAKGIYVYQITGETAPVHGKIIVK